VLLVSYEPAHQELGDVVGIQSRPSTRSDKKRREERFARPRVTIGSWLNGGLPILAYKRLRDVQENEQDEQISDRLLNIGDHHIHSSIDDRLPDVKQPCAPGAPDQ